MPDQLASTPADARAPPGHERLPSHLVKRALLALLTLSGSVAVSAVVAALHGVRPAQRFCAVALLVVGLMQFANTLLRLYEGHRGIEHMGRKLTVEFTVLGLVPLCVGVCVLSHQPSLPLLAGYAAISFGSFVVAEPLERRIAEVIDDAGERPITAYVKSLQWPARWFFDEHGRSLGEVLSRAGGLVGTVGRALLDVPPGRVGLVRFAMVATLALATVGLGEAPFLAFSGADISSAPRVGHHQPAHGSGQAHAHVGGHRAAPQRQGAAAAASSAVPRPAVAERWEQACLTEPGAEAPASAPWVGRDFHDLYLGSSGTSRVPPGNEAPGAAAGCTGRIERVRGSRDSYFTIATDQRTGEIGSIAVDSLKYGPALFIAPAALPVRALLRRYKTLGGSPRHRAGRGDFYLIRLDIGTVMLVRAQYQQAAHPGLVEAYVQLDPAVAQAWLECMHEHHGWLWPIRRSLPHDSQDIAYDFVDRIVDPTYRVTVTYSPTTQIAHRPTATQTRYYMPNGFQLSEGELVGLAATAR